MVPGTPRNPEQSAVESAAAFAAAAMCAAAESLQARLELVLDEKLGALSADQRGFLQVAKKDGERLLKLIGDFHEIALAEAGLLELDWGRTDLVAATTEAVDVVSARAHALGKSLAVRAETSAVLAADEARTAEAVRRLAQHAVQHSSPGSAIDLEVRDTGLALRYESESAPAGDALGVAFARAIARAHGGSLGVRCEGGFVEIEVTFVPVDAGVVPIGVAA